MGRCVLLLKLSALVLAGATLANAQAPDPHKLFTTHNALVATDFTARTLDLISTHKALNNPCGCMHESDPLAPQGKSWGPEIGFQYGMFSAVSMGSQMLRKRGHTRLATVALIVDIASEGWAVQNNFRLKPNPVQKMETLRSPTAK